MHIELDDEIVRQVDQLAGPRERTAFVRNAILRALDEAHRSQSLRAAAGSLAEAPAHDWDNDAAAWVHEARRGDPRRAG